MIRIRQVQAVRSLQMILIYMTRMQMQTIRTVHIIHIMQTILITFMQMLMQTIRMPGEGDVVV